VLCAPFASPLLKRSVGSILGLGVLPAANFIRSLLVRLRHKVPPKGNGANTEVLAVAREYLENGTHAAVWRL